MLNDLKDKVVLITGSSTGIGAAAAVAFGKLGARVAVHYNSSKDQAEQVLKDVKATGAQASLFHADVMDSSQCQRLVNDTVSTFGRIDILINNAGAAWGAAAEDHSLEAWDKVMDLNIRGYFILSQYIGKHSMIPRGKGSIINVASIAGLGGNPAAMKTIAYNTSKGAVVNFTRALAAEWGSHNIRVNAICPGFFPR